MRHAAFPTLAGLLLLAGCAAPGDCDPTRTTFISGLACAGGGGYQARQDQLGSQAAAAQSDAQQARQRAYEAEQQRGRDLRELSAVNQRVRQQDASLARLRRDVERLRRERGATDAQLQQVRAAMAEAERPAGAPPPSAAELRERDQALERARASLQALTGI